MDLGFSEGGSRCSYIQRWIFEAGAPPEAMGILFLKRGPGRRGHLIPMTLPWR